MRYLPLLVLVACGGSQTEPVRAPGDDSPADSVVEQPPAAPSGLATISVDDLRAHVELLASDKYAGRETLTRGAEMAADYLSKQFKSYGLSPLPGHESFKVPYKLERYGYDPQANSLSLESGSGHLDLVLGTDFTPFNFSDSGAVDGARVVFAGYGITAPKLGWDDYKGLDVRGKVVLVLRHTPNEDQKENNPLAEGPYGQFVAKARNAQEHGAVGMLLVTDPRHHGKGSDDFKPPSIIRLPRTPEEKARLAKMIEARDKARAAARKRTKKRSIASDSLLAAHISQDAARALLPDLENVQEQLDAGKLSPRKVRVKATASMKVQSSDKPSIVTSDNVIGVLPGSDPKRRDEWVVVGGHYDHLGQSGKTEDNIYNGADDNASGTAGVLELAQAFASLPTAPARSIVFIGFSGEEEGLLGSFAALSEHQLPEDKLVFMLNLDMIGRNPERPVEIVGDAYSSGIRAIIEKAVAEMDLEVDFSGTNYAGNSDHHAFFSRDIPMTFFFTGLHKDYHQLSDHADKIAYERMAKIVRVGYRLIEPLAAGEITPAFIHNLNWLGVTIQLVDGKATFTGVEDGSRGARAGIAVGDVIVSIAGEPLDKPREVGRRFAKLEPGTAADVELRRGGVARTVKVVRAKRGYLGVFPGPITDEVRKKHGLGEDEGLLIRSVVPKGPAAKSGMKKGDILIRIGGVPVGVRTLGKQLSRIGAGEKTNIVVVRGDERVDLTMVLGER